MSATITELIKIKLDSFQEWPQLLDAQLSQILKLLNDAFLQYITRTDNCASHRHALLETSISSLPKTVCQILCVLCKVRGYKVILRLLNNEARYVAPLLRHLSRDALSLSESDPSVWEEWYVLLLWLSHLMLAPFDLATIAASSSSPAVQDERDLFDGLPTVAVVILQLGFSHACSPGK